MLRARLDLATRAEAFIGKIVTDYSFPIPTMHRGAFILLEGVDRSGKSTQCKRLVQWLTSHGVPAKSYGFPSRELLGVIQWKIGRRSSDNRSTNIFRTRAT